MGLMGVNVVIRACPGIAGVYRGLRAGVTAASPVSGQKRREDLACFYLMFRFSIVSDPLWMVSVPLITV
jgi:hypothetical protein